jgi:hypothetical protein
MPGALELETKMATIVIFAVISASLGAGLCYLTGSRKHPLFTYAIWGLLLLAGILARSWARNADAYEGMIPAFFLVCINLPALAGGMIGGGIGMWRGKHRLAAA